MAESDAPVRFFAIAYSDYEGYWETFVFATSAEDALAKYRRYMNITNAANEIYQRYPRKDRVDILAGELNEFGVLVSTDVLITDAIVECN